MAKETRSVFSKFPNKGIMVHETNNEFQAHVIFTNKDKTQDLLRYASKFCPSETKAIGDLIKYLCSDEGYVPLTKVY